LELIIRLWYDPIENSAIGSTFFLQIGAKQIEGCKRDALCRSGGYL